MEWKSGDEDYDESRRTVLDDPSSHSHTVTGLTEGVEHTLRATAFNVFGDGEYAAVTTSNSPATGLPTISGHRPGGRDAHRVHVQASLTRTG